MAKFPIETGLSAFPLHFLFDVTFRLFLFYGKICIALMEGIVGECGGAVAYIAAAHGQRSKLLMDGLQRFYFQLIETSNFLLVTSTC